MNWRHRGHHWHRYRELAQILVRHGLGLVAARLGLVRWWPWHSRTWNQTVDWPERIRRVLVEMGSTFVKFGQIASTRADLLPAALIRALERLQDDVPPFDFSEVDRILHEAWGQPPAEMLAWLDPNPLAQASIAQVHRARLFDGSPVVVKVRRPGIVEKANADFALIEHLAEVAERRTDWAKLYGAKRLVTELVRTLSDELDFTVEARNTALARERLRSVPDVLVPRVIDELSGNNVLVLQEIPGVKISDAQELLAWGVDLRGVATGLIGTFYRQIFVEGMFHADPHPGNIHVDAAGHLILLDWGMVGFLSGPMRAASADLIWGMTEGDAESVARALVRMGAVSHPGPGVSPEEELDWPRLVQDVERMRQRYYTANLSQFNLGQALTDLLGLAEAHHIRIPAEYGLVAKVAVTLDGVVRGLDPSISLVEVARPFVWRMLRDQFAPRRLLSELFRYGREWGTLVERLPITLDQLFTHLEKGEFLISVEDRHLDKLFDHWTGLADRLSSRLLLGALLVGMGFLVSRSELLRLFHMPFTEYVFIAAVFLTLWTVLDAIRKDHY